MGHTIESFPRRRRGRPPIYDWDSCFDGQIHVWYQGTDFHTALDSFRALVHRTASSRDGGAWKAATQLDKERKSVSFRFYIEGSEGA